MVSFILTLEEKQESKVVMIFFFFFCKVIIVFKCINCMHFYDLQSIREVSARISHLEQVLKEKSTDLEKTEDLDEKEALRHEIHSLRKTKECLSEERSGLDEKFQKVSWGCNEKNIPN